MLLLFFRSLLGELVTSWNEIVYGFVDTCTCYIKLQLMLSLSLSARLLQCVASHSDTRMLFLNGNVVGLVNVRTLFAL